MQKLSGRVTRKKNQEKIVKIWDLSGNLDFADKRLNLLVSNPPLEEEML